MRYKYSWTSTIVRPAGPGASTSELRPSPRPRPGTAVPGAPCRVPSPPGTRAGAGTPCRRSGSGLGPEPALNNFLWARGNKVTLGLHNLITITEQCTLSALVSPKTCYSLAHESGLRRQDGRVAPAGLGVAPEAAARALLPNGPSRSSRDGIPAPLGSYASPRTLVIAACPCAVMAERPRSSVTSATGAIASRGLMLRAPRASAATSG